MTNLFLASNSADVFAVGSRTIPTTLKRKRKRKKKKERKRKTNNSNKIHPSLQDCFLVHHCGMTAHLFCVYTTALLHIVAFIRFYAPIQSFSRDLKKIGTSAPLYCTSLCSHSQKVTIIGILRIITIGQV